MTVLILYSNDAQPRKREGSQSIVVSLNREVEYGTFFKELIENEVCWESCVFDAADHFREYSPEPNSQLKYRNISLIHTYSNKFLSGHTELLANTIYKIRSLRKLINQIEPEKLRFLAPQGEWELIAKSICESENIPYEISGHRITETRSGDIHWKPISLFGKTTNVPIPGMIFPFLLRIRYWLQSTGSKSPPKGVNYDVIFYMANSKWSDSMKYVLKELGDSGLSTLLLVEKTSDYDNLNQILSIDIANINRFYKNGEVDYKGGGKFDVHSPGVNEFCNICGVDVEEIFLPVLKEISHSAYKPILYKSTMNRIIDEYDPGCLVMPHDSQWFVKAFVSSCNENEVESICIRTGSANLTSEVSTFNADKLLVPGRSTLELFREFSIQEDDIKITGLPQFVDLLNMVGSDGITRRLKKELGISRDKNIITYLAQTTSGTYTKRDRRQNINTFCEIVSDNPNWHLIIKTHPSVDPSELLEGVDDHFSVTVVEENLNEILVASNMAATRESTTGFNSLLAGCSLLIANLHGGMNKNKFVDAGVAPIVENRTDLVKFLTSGSDPSIDQQKVQRFLNHHYQCYDYSAARNIREEVQKSVR